MKSDAKKLPPYVNFALQLDPVQMTKMNRRVSRSPHKFKFTETAEQKRRKLFVTERKRKRVRY